MNTIIRSAICTLAITVSSTALADKSAGNHVDDSWIHTKVKSTLALRGGSGINIEVYQGIVQLAGFVDSESREKKILEAAATVDGVKVVDDQIHVVAADRSAGETLDDATIASSVKAALADSAEVSGFDVNVESNRGVVLLSGFVESNDSADEAVKIAEGIKGVNKVINGTRLKGE